MLLLDFGLLLAREKAQGLGVKTRELWLDLTPAQTLREICTSVIAILWAGDAPITWSRMTERTLEKRFGRVRSRFASAQMSIGDYFRSSLKLMQGEVRRFQEKDRPIQKTSDGSIGEKPFQEAASRAFQGALKLATMCSHKSRKELQASFTNSFAEFGSNQWDDEGPVEDEGRWVPSCRSFLIPQVLQTFIGFLDAKGFCMDSLPCIKLWHCLCVRCLFFGGGGCWASQLLPAGQNHEKVEECADIFERIRASHAFCTKAEKENESDQENAAELLEDGRDPHMEELLQDHDDPDADPKKWWEPYMPREGRYTLEGALRSHESFEAAKEDVWRLLFFLRSAPGGADNDIVAKPLSCRQKVLHQPDKWHNALMHSIALMDSQDKQPAARLGRQQAWMQHTEKQRAEHCPTLPKSLEVSMGDLIIAKVGGTWQAAFVLSVYRNYKSRSGGV